MKPAFSSLIAVCFILALTLKVSGQVTNYGNLYSKPLLLNHAYTGSNKAPRLTVSGQLYRSFGKQPKLSDYYMSFDHGFKSSGFSLQYSAENESVTYIGSFLGTYSHTFKVSSKLTLTPALSVGLITATIDFDELSLDQEIINGVVVNYPDKATGKMLNTGISFLAEYGNFTAGLNMDQINSPKIREEFIYDTRFPQYQLHADYKIRFNDDIQLLPGLIYYDNKYYNTNPTDYFLPTLRFRMRYFELGLSHRFDDQLIDLTTVSLGINYKWVSFNYAYLKYGVPSTRTCHEFTVTSSLKELKM